MKFAGGCFALVLAMIVSRSALVRAAPPADCSTSTDPSGCLNGYTNLGTEECPLECCNAVENPPVPLCCPEVMKECDDFDNDCAPSVCTCMGDEAVRYTNIQGETLAIDNIRDPIKGMVCTSNDVRVARARVVSINGSSETENAKCSSGDILNISLVIDLVSGASSRRSEIGIWTSTTGNWVVDGSGAESSALSGSCDHSFFYNRTDLPDLDRLDDEEEADNCGDIAEQLTYPDLPLKTSETSLGVETITVKCQSTDSSELVTVPSCIAWKQPGEDDQICDLDYDADGNFYPYVYDRQDYIYATLPGTKSKCRCSNDIVLNITVVNPSNSPSANPSESPSAKPSLRPSSSPSDSPSEQPSSEPSESPSTSPSQSPSSEPSPSPSESPSDEPSSVPSPSPSATPSASPSASSSAVPSPQPSENPSASPSQSPSSEPSPSPSESPSDEPSSVPSPSPSATPSASPSASSSAVPSPQPSENPSASPSQSPSSEPSPSPSESPSDEPSSVPSPSPSATPSASPSASSSEVPSPQPSDNPSTSPSQSPSSEPSPSPSESPSDEPSSVPSPSPSATPSASPSASSSEVPSPQPSDNPSTSPSQSPSSEPSPSPSESPSDEPSSVPSPSPSATPSASPSVSPSEVPSPQPSQSPSASPSQSPSVHPSLRPSARPSLSPSASPSLQPSQSPSASPSNSPSSHPSLRPSLEPSSAPSSRCEVMVEKTCAIVPSTEPEVQTCDDLKPVTHLTMIWDGADGVTITTPLEVLNNVQNGDVITFQANKDVMGNDFKIELTGSVSGDAEFHLSCSDDYMYGYDDCGKNQGDGKDNDDKLINDFLFGGMTGENGQFTCPEAEAQTGSSEFPEESDKCDFVASEEAASCSDLKPVTHLTMIWDGADGVTITTPAPLEEVFNNVQNGDVITFQANKDVMGNDFKIELTGSVSGDAEFHLSCSDDDMNGPEDCGKNQGDGKDNDDKLINDFLFGGMRGENGEFGCTGIPSSTAGTNVIYGFRVINPNDRNLTVQIVDATLNISQTATVPANDAVEVVTDEIYILPDDTNVFNNTVEVTADFETGTGDGCSASDSVLVERIEPSAPTDTEGCFGWAYTTSNCMKGTYGKDGLDLWTCNDDGSIVQCGGDGDKIVWVDDVDDADNNDPINCNTSVSDESLKRMPARKGEDNACPDGAKTDTRDDHRECLDEAGMLIPACDPVEVTYRTTEESHNWKKSSDGGTTESLLTQLDCIDITFENRVECDTSNSGGGCDMAFVLGGGLFQTCKSHWYAACDDDNCYSQSGCSSEDEVTCPFDSYTDGKARYKITFTVKNTVDCARCWISTASVFLYDYTKTDYLDSTTMCPLDDKMDSLSEKSEIFDPLPKTVNLYPKNKMEVFSAAAYLWCGAADGSGNNIGKYMDNDGIFKTMFQNKILCDPDKITATNDDDDCEVHEDV